MASLTTVDDIQITFDPVAVAAVADRDPVTGAVLTCVYGIAPGVITIQETVGGFLDRLGIAGIFAELTRPDGSSVWINATAVGTLRAPLPDEYPPAARSVIVVGSLTQAVIQDPATVKVAIDALGGHQ